MSVTAESPNILTSRQRCARQCGYTHPKVIESPDVGDVRRCEHGKIWRATGRSRENIFFQRLDEWERLDWWTPLAYRRAVRALEDEHGA